MSDEELRQIADDVRRRAKWCVEPKRDDVVLLCSHADKLIAEIDRLRAFNSTERTR